MISPNLLQLVSILWNYMRMDIPIKKSDVTIVFGSHDHSVAERGIDLYLAGWSEHIVFSGGFGHMTEGIWNVSEAETFAELALSRGVPASAILVENKSTNTGENVIFSIARLKEAGLNPKRYLLVHKPYMERRTFAAFKKKSTDTLVSITSPQVSLENYVLQEKSAEDFINMIVGDFQRISLYADSGFQIPQIVPDFTMKAFHDLVNLGYDRRVINP